MSKINFLKNIKKVKWLRYGKWTTPFLMDCIISNALSVSYLTHLGNKEIKLQNHLVVDGEYYWDEKEYNFLKSIFNKSLRTNPHIYLDKFYRFNLEKTQIAMEQIDTLFKKNFSSLSDREIARAFDDWLELIKPLMNCNTFMMIFDEEIEPIIKTNLQKLSKLSDGVTFSLLMIGLIPPKKNANVIEEEDALLAISSQIYRNEKLRKIFISQSLTEIKKYLVENEKGCFQEIKGHCVKYRWLSAIDWWGQPFTLNYYIGRIKDFLWLNPKVILDDRIRERERKEIFIIKKLKNIKAPDGFKKLISVSRNLIDLKQDQWDVISISGYLSRPLLSEISKRIGINSKGIMQLSSDEIKSALGGKKVSIVELKERLKHRAVVYIGNSYYFYSGKSALKIFRLMHKEKEKIGSTGIQGTVSFPGLIKGRVRVISTIEKINTIRQGEILVCPMTNPDYMPAIHKATAIITDKGGILCHAAIISRELKIPCIIGTKIATKVLKDGDLVEVDANTGIVKKLST